jgi:hypothetical protein
MSARVDGAPLALLLCLVAAGRLAGPPQAAALGQPDRGHASSRPDEAPPAPSLGAAVKLPQVNAGFERRDGWIGADGAYSVRLTPQQTLWLFSDTWVGSVRDGKRTGATVVNNSVALQEGHGSGARMRFVVREGTPAGHTALITPRDGRGWFWLQAGACVDKRLFLWLNQVEKTGGTGVFAFRPVGQWLGVVANPLEEPTTWRIRQLKLPCTIFTPRRELTFGAAVLEDGGYLYIYGTDEEVRAVGRNRHLIVARVGTGEVEKFDAWRCYSGGEWVSDFRTASGLVGDMASECSVSYLPGLRRYLLVYTEGGLSRRVLARSARAPWGPWSAPRLVYECPEAGWDRRIFCYGAKAHPELAAGDELVISYVANSFDFWQVAADARLYWPRFIRVQVRPD